ncbi:MAG: ribonuclease D [Acidimicrobiales bacterium]|nr:ribonuclease D [Acidimicrobiia bacterium]NNC79939.1 ribonuclease D [Acidimicrobiales bacterium]RZV43479.1 MAG: ribonuclease D [Acidimicrobiales bacterium]
MSDDYRVIDEDDAFKEYVASCEGISVFAIDTEFHRERSYFPKVALIQINNGTEVVLIDPLAVDSTPLADLFTLDATAVLHAASQDLEVFEHWADSVPKRIFDTQLAAGFTGLSTPSLAALHDKVLRISLPKTSRLTDWLARPLTEDQLDYAASDVAHLLELRNHLVAELEDRGRLEWAENECELLRTATRGPRDPDEAWRRIKAVRQLKGESLGAARALAAWRETQAARLDQPVRFILSDLALVGIAQRKPTTPDQLKSIRGVDDRLARNETGELLLRLVEEGQALPAPKKARQPSRPTRPELRPAVSLVTAWVAQLAGEVHIDPALLGTRADIESFVRGDPDARLAHGWRAELVGDPAKRLMTGDAALAFDGDGGLVLEERSGNAISPR